MEFWGLEVKSGEILPVLSCVGMVLRLSQATLGKLKEENGNESVCLFATVDGKKLVLATLYTTNLPQQHLGMVFDRDFELSHDCKNGSVYFYGYRINNTLREETKYDESEEAIPHTVASDEVKLEDDNSLSTSIPPSFCNMDFERTILSEKHYALLSSMMLYSTSPSFLLHSQRENKAKMKSRNTDLQEIWEAIIPYVKASEDRAAVSLVCKSWFQIDEFTREHITVKSAYVAKLERLFWRFPNLRSLKIKGMSPKMMHNFWMGSRDKITPWFAEIVKHPKIEAVDVRRMIVLDGDLELLVTSNLRKAIKVLKLQECGGFSTHGLLSVTRQCRGLRTLSLERSNIIDHSGEWLHELALNTSALENLNFYKTGLGLAMPKDLELISRNCASLVSVKITTGHLNDLNVFFEAATALQEFGVACSPDITIEEFEELYSEFVESIDVFINLDVQFPHSLSHLSLISFGSARLSILLLIGSRFKKLDLQDALLDTKNHCDLLAECPNLEIFKTTEIIGDEGLEVVAATCKKMKKLRIYRRKVDQAVEGLITEKGLIDLSKGCAELKYLTIYMSSITNEALKCVGRNMKKLCDFRLMLFVVNPQQKLRQRVLDIGVRSLLKGCPDLTRLSLLFYTYWLTANGIKSIGKYGKKVKVMQLGNIVRSDEMLKFFENDGRSRLCNSIGLQKLETLDMWNCCFSGTALTEAVRELNSLRFLWIQGEVFGNMLPHFVIETFERIKHHRTSTHHLANRSLDGE